MPTQFTGTEVLARLEKGTELNVLTGLGNGFRTALSGMRPLLAGGGISAVPLCRLAKELIALGASPLAVPGLKIFRRYLL